MQYINETPCCGLTETVWGESGSGTPKGYIMDSC
jgi:hypothetical protein